MKRIALVLAVLALAAPAFAGGRSHGLSTNSRGTVRACSDLRVTFDDDPAAVSEEIVTLRDTDLTARPAKNGGVWVQAEDRGDFAITVCRAAERSDVLPRIQVALKGSHLSVDGPGDDSWVVNLIVKAPRAASLDLSTFNGPIEVRGLSGTLKGTTINGPISVKDSPGRIDVEASNGPVSVSGLGGIVRAHTDNGPMSVVANGMDWDGDIEASTTNGPVSLDLPDGFAGTAVVQSQGHSPVKCRHSACREGGARYWDEDGDPRIQIGSGKPVIRLSTSNGPVTVDSAKS